MHSTPSAVAHRLKPRQIGMPLEFYKAAVGPAVVDDFLAAAPSSRKIRSLVEPSRAFLVSAVVDLVTRFASRIVTVVITQPAPTEFSISSGVDLGVLKSCAIAQWDAPAVRPNASAYPASASKPCVSSPP